LSCLKLCGAMAARLAISRTTSRSAVFKCLAASKLAGLEVVPVAAAQAQVELVGRDPTLIGQDGVEIFGEHAICTYVGAAGKTKLQDSIEGQDWLEADQAGQVSKLEERFAKKSAQIAGDTYLGGKSAALGIADVCVACSLFLARRDGVTLGDVSSKWLDAIVAAHPVFEDCLAAADKVAAKLQFSYVAHQNEQCAGLQRILGEACATAIKGAVGSLVTEESVLRPIVSEGNKRAKNPAEFQLNNAIGLFRVAGKDLPDVNSPEEMGKKIAASLKSQSDVFGSVVENVDVAKPGFINLFLSQNFISGRIRKILEEGRLKPPHTIPETVGVDFSSPNAAKEMHVGHLRSTIIGEVLCRVLAFSGHEVKRINHIGDWGTQFGMLLTYMKQNVPNYLEAPPNIQDLDEFYRASKSAFDASDEFKNEARQEVVRLQAGDETAVAAWKQFLSISGRMLDAVYLRLGVTFPDGLKGESFYNSRIPAIVKEMQEKGFVKNEDGALCIFTKANPVPLFLVKRDGGYGYDSTDLACLKYRIQEEKMKRILYVTDLGQEKHFMAIFEAGTRAGWTDGVSMEHVGFGMVQGEDKKRFRTRDGGTVRLVDLLDESKKRAKDDLVKRSERGGRVAEADMDVVAGKIGYSAIKYFDLKNSREKDYVFNYESMLSSEGDTAVYLMYSYARICSVEAKVASMVGEDVEAIIQRALPKLNVSRDRPKEWALAMALLQFPDAVELTMGDLKPHVMCKYVYELASAFTKFYGDHQLLVPDASNPDKRVLDPSHGENWLALIRAVKIALRDSFELLSIEPVEGL